MIKRIIFDVDDTLIKFPTNFDEGYKKVINKHNLNINSEELFKIIGMYELSGKYKYYNKRELVKLISENIDIELTDKFIEDFFDMYNKLITPIQKETIDTLKYLSKKYELVVLSNWFTDSQIERLKCVGIYKYFKKVYGTDIIPMKPRKESFLSVIGDRKIDECLMIGDNLEVDIKIPYLMGMNVYYLTDKETNYPSIKKISDLKELL